MMMNGLQQRSASNEYNFKMIEGSRHDMHRAQRDSERDDVGFHMLNTRDIRQNEDAVHP